jgi:hypothetical protein
MAGTPARRTWVLALLLVVVGLAGLVPLLRADEARRQAAWVFACVGSGGAVSAEPAPRDNPLVVQLPRPTYECRDATGVLVSVRD